MPREDPDLIACIEGGAVAVAKDPKHGGPRPGAGRPRSNTSNVAVKLDKEAVRDAKAIAALRGISLVKYLNSIVRPIVKRDLAGEIKKMSRHTGEGEKP